MKYKILFECRNLNKQRYFQTYSYSNNQPITFDTIDKAKVRAYLQEVPSGTNRTGNFKIVEA